MWRRQFRTAAALTLPVFAIAMVLPHFACMGWLYHTMVRARRRRGCGLGGRQGQGAGAAWLAVCGAAPLPSPAATLCLSVCEPLPSVCALHGSLQPSVPTCSCLCACLPAGPGVPAGPAGQMRAGLAGAVVDRVALPPRRVPRPARRPVRRLAGALQGRKGRAAVRRAWQAGASGSSCLPTTSPAPARPPFCFLAAAPTWMCW